MGGGSRREVACTLLVQACLHAAVAIVIFVFGWADYKVFGNVFIILGYVE